MLSFIRSILLSYRDFMVTDHKEITFLIRNSGLPKIEESRLIELCNYSIEILKRHPTLERLNGPAVAVGDLHGSIVDLLRIFGIYGLPFMFESNIQNSRKHMNVDDNQCQNLKYVFLGDYVDRGEFSVEVMTVLLSAFCLYPKNIILLRGNHEFSNVSSQNCFKNEILAHPAGYSPELFHKFQEVFSYLPFSAVVNGNIFCVHGGLSSKLNSLKDIENLSELRPIFDFKDNTLIQDLVWSDPSKIGCCKYIPSTRNQGCIYGSSAVNSFYKNTGIRAIIRGHSYVKRGIEIYGHINLISVFSSSSYLRSPTVHITSEKDDESKKSKKNIYYQPQTSYDENLCGVVFINENSEMIPETFEAVDVVTRSETKLKNIASISFASSQTLYQPQFQQIDSNKPPSNIKQPETQLIRKRDSRKHRVSDTTHTSSNTSNLAPNSQLWKPKKKMFSFRLRNKKFDDPLACLQPNSQY